MSKYTNTVVEYFSNKLKRKLHPDEVHTIDNKLSITNTKDVKDIKNTLRDIFQKLQNDTNSNDILSNYYDKTIYEGTVKPIDKAITFGRSLISFIYS